MNSGAIESARAYGHRLIQVGASLFLVALFVGFAIPRFALPRLGLSTHLLGLMQGTLLMVVGLVWPRLALPRRLSLAGCGLAIYGCLAAWTANLCGAIWAAGGAMVPLAAGAARGTVVQEAIIRLLLVSGALCLVGAAGILVWGLGGSTPSESAS
jgi:hydroxylaminobenzene mutase